MKCAIFMIGSEEFGIETELVVEFLGGQKVYRLPEMPDFLAGVITLRREIIPLLDLRIRFGITKSASEEELIIVVKHDGEKIGLLVDEIKSILSFDEEEIAAPPAIFRGLRSKYLTGLGQKQNRVIILLNIEGLLSSEEKIALQEAITEYGGETGSEPVAERE
jgi:purine-binding chemotaxis protein CheW